MKSEPRSVADKFAVLALSHALNFTELFYLEIKATNVSIELIPF